MTHRITLIAGDGIGPEVSEAVLRILKVAGLSIEWEPCEAGVVAFERYGTALPLDLLDSVRKNKVALKGPVTTPIGEGFTVRQRRASQGAGALRERPSGLVDRPASSRATRASTSSSCARTPKTCTPVSSTKSSPASSRASKSSRKWRQRGSAGSRSTTRGAINASASPRCTRPTS